MGAAVGVTIEPTDPKQETLNNLAEVDKLCRGGLRQERRDYDVADIIDLIVMGALVQRALHVTTMIENAMETGKRLGTQQR